MSFHKKHKYSWEIFRLISIFFTLMIIFLLVNQAQLQKWSLVSMNDTLDISEELSLQIYDIECYTLNALSFPSYIAITVAAFNAGKNDRLTLPIRVLAVFEHIFKFISTLLMSGALFVKKTPIK
ncbi:unnamed protein product, partial [Mesorhabditis belari]|uniref:Uncharacterized protein n=1 Tax=Mesorhabditis belari TaxID=2138241 RepID=A0AAF3FJ47_9BILA